MDENTRHKSLPSRSLESDGKADMPTLLALEERRVVD